MARRSHHNPEWRAVTCCQPQASAGDRRLSLETEATSNTEAQATLGVTPEPASCVENCSSHQITGLCISLNLSEAAPSVFKTWAKTSTTTGITLSFWGTSTAGTPARGRLAWATVGIPRCTTMDLAEVSQRTVAHSHSGPRTAGALQYLTRVRLLPCSVRL